MAEHDDSDIARVLRAIGKRVDPTEDVARSVYAAVHAEWREAVTARARPRRQRVWLAAAASIVVAAVALFIGREFFSTSEPELVANVSRLVGAVEMREGDAGKWENVTTNGALHVGEAIHTGPDGRLTLALRDGVSLRLDHDTSIALVSPDRIDVSAGAVYVDSGVPALRAGRLQVGTPSGVIRHVGTQYEARIVTGGTRVRVREGRVDVTPVRGSARTLQVGEQILVSSAGIEDRSRIEPSSDDWDWASKVAPDFDIDGRPVHDFLAWAGRETGLQVVFASPESAAEAQRAVLSGSVAGLGPDEALAAVMPTTSLRSTERNGELVIELAKSE